MIVDKAAARISAAMIVRNEERFLGDCLQSIVDEVDEIVIVDTGSVDRTCKIAAEHGARIIHRPWTEDFSAARNCALEHASGDWVLYIDADERLEVPAAGALRATVAAQGVVAFSLQFQPQAGFTFYRELRLFRRDDRIRFHGVIHETVHPDLDAVAQADGLSFGESDIRLCHVGYEGDLTAKHHRNLPLLESAVRETPERVFLWVDLAQALAGLGRREEAVAACWQAVEAADTYPDEKQAGDVTLAWQCLVTLHMPLNPSEAALLAHRGLSAHPHSHGLRLMLANALFMTGEAGTLLELLTALIAIDGETFADTLIAYDKRIFGEWAFDLLGAAYARMGRRNLAARAFRQAAALAPDNLAYRIKAAAFSSHPARRRHSKLEGPKR